MAGNPEAELIACRDCDALYRLPEIAPGIVARCARCGAVLRREPLLRPDQLLALVIAALITILIANAFPIVDLKIRGEDSVSTLFGGIMALWHEGRGLVALLVFATAILFPLADLAAMAFVLLALGLEKRPAALIPVLRAIQAIRPWSMVEIFMLGVLVALVKLSHMAEVRPGPALWAFAVLTLLLAAIVSYDIRTLWRLIAVPPGRKVT